MKRKGIIISIILALTLAFSLTACSPESTLPPDDGVIEITGFTVESDIVVESGQSVFVVLPSVQDEYGNVLDVDYTVLDAQSAQVSVQSGTFFALSTDGYTINYKVVTSDEVEHTASTKIHVISPVKDGNLRVSRGEDYDISAFYPTAIPGYETVVTVEKVGVTNTAVDGAVENKKIKASALGEGYYLIKITLDGKTDFEYASLYLDVEKSNLPVWNTASATAEIYTRVGGATHLIENGATLVNLTEQDGLGKTGAFYKINDGEDGYTDIAFNLLPLHSKAYYEELNGYALTFDYYISQGAYVGINSNPSFVPNAGWYEASVSFARLCDIWEQLYGKNLSSDWGTVQKQNMFFLGNTNQDAYAFVGNFAIEYTGGRDEVTSVETSALTTYDIKTLLSQLDLAIIENYSTRATIEWKIISNAKEYDAPNGVVTVSEIDSALYVATATAVFSPTEKLVIFEAQLDFYDQTEEKTWNTVSADALGYAWGYQTDSSTAGGATVTVVENPEGRTGAYFKLTNGASTVNENTHFNLIPLHSKAYYESVADKNLMFDFFSLQSCYYDYDWAVGSEAHGGGASEWKTASVPIQTLLDEWDYIVGTATASQESQAMLFISGVTATRPTYIGNFRIDYDIPLITAQEKTLDTNGLSTYALTGLLSSEQLESYNEVLALGTVTWSVANALNPEITATVSANGDLNITSDLLTTAYAVSATLTINGKDYPLVKGKINLYDSTASPVWNAVSEQTLAYAWAYKNANATVESNLLPVSCITVVENPDGKTGKYFKVVSNESADTRISVNIMPLLEKSYYENHADKTLYFDIKVRGRAYHNWLGISTKRDIETDAWVTAKISVQTLLDEWDKIVSPVANGETNSMFYTTGVTDSYPTYIGNFRLDYDISPVSVTQTSVDLNGASSIALSTLTTSGTAPSLAGATEKWTVTDIFGNQTTLTGDAFTGLPLGDYTVEKTLELGGNTYTAISGTVRFTDGTNPLPVWNEITANTKPNETLMKKGNAGELLQNASVEIVTDPAGRTGTFLALEDGTNATNLGFNFLPRYGKDYYEQAVNGGKFALTFDYYIPIDGVWVGKASGASNTTKGWYSATITFEKLLENFDKLNAFNYNAENIPMLMCNSGNVDSQTEKIYIGNFAVVPVIEETVVATTSLVDIKNESTYSVRNLVNATALETVNSLGGTLNYAVTNGAGASVAVTDGAILAKDGVYTVSVKATVLGKEFNLYSGKINLYDSSNPVWLEVSEETLAYAWAWTGANSQDGKVNDCVSVVTNPQGKEGKYFKLNSPNASGTDMHYNFMPVSAKERYELPDMANRALVFDIYLESGTYYDYDWVQGSARTTSAGWITLSVPVSTLVSNYGAITGGWVNKEYTCMLFASGITQTRSAYLGNFRFGYSVTETAVNQTVDLLGANQINLDALISSTAISGATEKWTVTDIFGKQTTLAGDAFTGLPLGDYTVEKTLEIDGESYTAVSGTLRVVDGTKNPVWNEVTASTSREETYMRYCESYTELPNATIAIVTEAQGKTGNFMAINDSVENRTVLGFTFLARYAKDYYESLVASTDYTYTLTFEYYAVGGYQGGASGEWGSKNAGWYTMEIPLATLVEKWSLISSASTNSPKDLMLSISHASVDGLNYAGNFAIVATPV